MSGADTKSADPAVRVKPVYGWKRLLRGLAVLVVLGIVAIYILRTFFSAPDTHRLDVSGRLEGYETNLSPKIGGLVEFIAVREGDKVTKGQIVARLSDADYEAQLRGAEARIRRAQQVVQQKRDQLGVVEAQIAGAQKRVMQSREEILAQVAQARAGVAEAQAKAKQTQSELGQACAQLSLSSLRLQRYTSLVKKGAVTKDEYDQARTTHDTDTATVCSRKAAVQAAQKAILSAYATLRQQEAGRYTPPIRRSDVDVFEAQRSQAHHDVDAAEQDVSNANADRDQIKANLAYLKIVSPIDAVVTARPVEPGAVLTPGQTILTILDYRLVYMRGYVPEGRIGVVRINQKAQVFLDALPNQPFAAKVIEIDPVASFTPENIYFKDDRVKQVFGIKIGIKNPKGFAKPGMPADARLEL